MATPTNPPLLPPNKHDFKIPIPPPPLLTRPENMYFDPPGTPSTPGFTSPSQTPQGSPSKNRLPPGAHDLPHVFENALRLLPNPLSSPSKQSGAKTHSPTSPSKHAAAATPPTFGVRTPDAGHASTNDPFVHQQDAHAAASGSPTRKSNKENTPPGARPQLGGKEASYVTHAAASRHDVYKPAREQEPMPSPPARQSHAVQRGLSAEELEKVQKPSVKRLANVTQLCECIYFVAMLLGLSSCTTDGVYG